ncbi:hypothetical protein JTB14_033860 [Gonioctena quinquepunctata]|nr:hypothetical protein JTB14_033860 [Gonioctena quinquepunctata]
MLNRKTPNRTSTGSRFQIIRRIQYQSAWLYPVHLNATLLNGCLTKAKLYKSNCVVVFLDITEAYDSIGHQHINRTLQSSPLPTSPREPIVSF